ncbi:helix-turn-helix transcriptional regulator [Duganella sp. S19_KUP01_CR8]|uniref:helix-turn-helix transcriptional regulator n=1 Tax=Duganella sp. S19_KUP01_CR8 TaxID=3025502 RepID=UPI002FCDCD89
MDTTKTVPGTRRLIRIREVLQLCGMSRATLYREIKLHMFPAPVKLSARSVAWLYDDVMQWIDARVAQRGPAFQTNSQVTSRDTKKESAIGSVHCQSPGKPK